MEAAQEIQITELNQSPTESNQADQEESSVPGSNSCKRWLQISIYTFLAVCGQTVATLLGRLYYENRGSSKWMASLVQFIGFPILFPYYFYSTVKEPATTDAYVKPASSVTIGSAKIDTDVKPASPLTVGLVYFTIGLLVAGNCYLYQVGLKNLPVTTYSLICASQLAFNAFFSYFLNSQKFTPLIVNALFLLTISSTLLVFNKDSQSPTNISNEKYVIGFLCTVGASAMLGLILSLTQLAFQKVLTKPTFSSVINLLICQSLISSCAVMVALFASGEWKGITSDMQNYKTGKASYIMNLVWMAVSTQVATIGGLGLIFEVSALFSNAISALSLPIVPVLAVIVFHDKMDGVKGISLVTAIWGSISYVYQQYLDEKNAKSKNGNGDNNGAKENEQIRRGSAFADGLV